jgi:hypothetical protein
LYTPCILGLGPFAPSNKIELLIKKNTWMVCVRKVQVYMVNMDFGGLLRVLFNDHL